MLAMTPFLRWILVVGFGLVCGAMTGLAAAYLRTGGWDLRSFVAFGVATCPVFASLAMVFAHQGDEVAHPAETVEHEWAHQALAQTALDLFILVGSTTAAVGVAGLDQPGIGWLLPVMMVDVALRFGVPKHRHA